MLRVRLAFNLTSLPPWLLWVWIYRRQNEGGEMVVAHNFSYSTSPDRSS